jgi:hypothetical protein
MRWTANARADAAVVGPQPQAAEDTHKPRIQGKISGEECRHLHDHWFIYIAAAGG